MPPSVATIGFFDGVHRGHRFLINQVKEVAAKDGIFCIDHFPVHPRQVIQTAYRPQLLSSPTEKLELLETMQVDTAFFSLLHRNFHCFRLESLCSCYVTSSISIH